MVDLACWTYFGDSTSDLEIQIRDLIRRGGIVHSLAIAYGPTPAKAASVPGAEDGWHAMLIVDSSGVDPDA